MNEKDQAWGLFWCSLLRPLIEGETEDEDAPRCLREIAAQEHVFPDGQRRKVSVSTLRRKWRAFQKGGFEALARKRRRDRGQSRKHTPELLQRAVELKKEQPLRSDGTINQFLKQQFGKTIPKATLYRQVSPARRWSFGDFAQTLAQLLGRRGGLSAFTSDELEVLGKLYPRVQCTEPFLLHADEPAPEKTIPAIAFQLQRLSDGGERTNP